MKEIDDLQTQEEERTKFGHAPPALVSKKTLIAFGAVIGTGLALLLAAVVIIALVTNHANSERINDIKAITKPTPQQFRKQVQEGFARCALEPKCLRSIRELVNSNPKVLRRKIRNRRNLGLQDLTRAGGTKRGSPPAEVQPGDGRRSPSNPNFPTAPRPRTPPSKPHDPPSKPPVQVTPTTPDIPPDPTRPPSITIPQLPGIHVCTGIITVNC